MSKKIGRNDLCPCGSGKKYKHCHMNGVSNTVKVAEPQEILQHPFSDFSYSFLLNHICPAFLTPGNHGKNIRLELLVREALFHGKRGAGEDNLEKLKTILSERYAHHYMEDPPVNLYTELITFYGGDYLVLPGISDSGVFILSNLLAAIFHTENTLPDKFKALIYDSALMMLTISDIVLKKAGFKRYQKGEFTTNEIILADEETNPLLNDALFISDVVIAQLAEQNKIPKEIIKFFTLKANDNLSDDDPDKNPIISRPILSVNGGYKIICPTNIHVAITHLIIEYGVRYDCLRELLNQYINIIWHNARMHLESCSFRKIEDFDLSKPDNLEVRDSVFRFDTDKIAYVDLQYDNGANYNTDHPYSSQHFSIENGKAENYTDDVFKRLKEKYPNDQILHIHLFAGIGREFYRAYRKTESVKSVSFSIQDFDIIMRTREYDSLMLWNYVSAKEDFQKTVAIAPMIDELDIFSFYKDHDDSFYLNDEAKPNFMVIEPGWSNKLIEKVTREEDIHAIFNIDEEGKLYAVPSLKLDWSPSIYTPISKIGVELVQVVEGYKQPIWIRFNGDIYDIDRKKRRIYIEYLDAISYWIWQITDGAKPHLDKLGDTPINVKFDFTDRKKIEDIEFKFDREPGLEEKFILKVSGSTIEILIPHEINPYLYGVDNEGERCLIKVLLKGFRQIQQNFNGTFTLSDDVIQDIINEHAPLGVKKKIFLINTENDLRLDPRGLKKVRYVQSYDINKILDVLVEKMQAIGAISGKPEKIADKNKFVRQLVSKVLFPMLTGEIEKYDSTLLLKHFMRLNEGLIHKRRLTLLNTPTRIACFFSVDQQIQSVNDDLHDIDQTALSVRCLIEHIAACPGKGKLIPSKSSLDYLVALMEQVISWGSLGDQINFDLFDVTVDILPSKRIGSDKTLSKEVFDPFRMSKAKEEVTDAIEDFEEKFSEPTIDTSKKIPDNVEQAFTLEFGISLTRIIEFSHVLTRIGFENDPGLTIMEETKLKAECKKILPDLTDGEFTALIEYYSLKKRNAIMEIPEDYKPYDVYPWRYNRGLSLIRKPLVIVCDENSNQNLIYWGARQMRVSGMQVLYLYYSGKLRTKEGGKLNTLIGDILNSKGHRFTQEVFDFLSSNLKNVILDKEVKIDTNSFLKADKDLGDIDVLIIDKSNRIISLIECKKVEVGKNIKQIVEEVGHLMGSESKKGWIAKHQARHEWVEKHRELLGKKYHVDVKEFKVISIVLTSEILSTKFLKKSILPFDMISYYELKENLLKAIYE